MVCFTFLQLKERKKLRPYKQLRTGRETQRSELPDRLPAGELEQTKRAGLSSFVCVSNERFNIDSNNSNTRVGTRYLVGDKATNTIFWIVFH